MHEADLKVTSDGKRWEKVELIRPDPRPVTDAGPGGGPERADALSMARLHRVLATLTLLVAATALCAAPALARKRDHDKLPDRWERKFHLNLKRDDAKPRPRPRRPLQLPRVPLAHEPAQEGLRPRRAQGRRRAPLRLQPARPGLRQRRDQGRQGERRARSPALTGSSITIRLAAGGKLTAAPRDRLLGRRQQRRREHRRRPGGEPGRRPGDRRRRRRPRGRRPFGGRPRRPRHRRRRRIRPLSLRRAG